MIYTHWGGEGDGFRHESTPAVVCHCGSIGAFTRSENRVYKSIVLAVEYNGGVHCGIQWYWRKIRLMVVLVTGCSDSYGNGEYNGVSSGGI